MHSDAPVSCDVEIHSMSAELACAPDGCVLQTDQVTLRYTAVLQCREAPKPAALNVKGNRSTRALDYLSRRAANYTVPVLCSG